MEKFYEMSSYSIQPGRKYAWSEAYGYFEGYDEFFDELTATKMRRSKFWEINPMPPGIEIESGARAWPDIMGSGFPPPGNFFSDKVLATFGRLGVELEKCVEIPIAKIVSKRLQKIPHPRYHMIKAFPGIRIPWEQMGLPVDEKGHIITKPLPKPWPPRNIVYTRDSWNGMKVFSEENFKTNGMQVFCTEEVKRAAEEDGWEGVHFEEITMV